jgi:phage regulator Rha-like protein
MMDIWQSHPKWNELEEICVQIETLKEKAKNLREEIRKDLFEEEKSKQKGLSYE